MKSVHLLLSAVLLSAAAPFIEDQQLSELQNEQQLGQFEKQKQSNQPGQRLDPFERQQLNQLQNEPQRLNDLGASYD